jgi:hypothetical protein
MSAFSKSDLYVSPQGNDAWSGALPEPNAEHSDGPLATIQRARDVVRRRKLCGELSSPLTVWLRGGRYALTQPLTFGPQDSAPVAYAAYPGETPVLDGGRPIGDWSEGELNGHKVLVASLPEVAAGHWYFRQLFVSGQRRQRPRLPKEGYYWIAEVPGKAVTAPLFEGSDTFRAAPGDIRPWRNLTDVEVVALHSWIEERMPIASFDEQSGLVTSTRTSAMHLRDDRQARFARYYVDNVLEALQEPGEWYLDRSAGKLYYMPLPGETAQNIEAVAPTVLQLLRLEGKPDEGQYVEFLRFEGLTFRHTDWLQPKGGKERFDSPGIDYASAPQAAFNVPGAIRLEGARYCAIEDCTLEHVGWYGIELADGCTGNRVVGNEIADLGAGGIKLDGSDAQGSMARRTGNNVVTDNHIHQAGRIFHSAVGILSVHSFGNEIAHNHIHDLYYSGISCGWVWGYAESVSKDNRIEKNHIHHIGQGWLSDMGGIYTLGVQPGTVLRGNLIHDIEKWGYGGWAIYPDEGSSHILIENNVCYDTNSDVFHQHYGRENMVRNNVFAFGREGIARHSRIWGRDVHPSVDKSFRAFVLERNILVSDGQLLFVGGHSAPLTRRNFLSDLNLLWDVSRAPLSGDAVYDAKRQVSCPSPLGISAWQALGQDTHSIVADPGFVDLEKRDFTLREDSPALALGFQPIDLSDVGPRPKDKRGG